MMGLYNIPTQSLNIFDKYIEQIKPYHTKILDSSVTFTYTDYINVTVRDTVSILINEGIPYSNAYVCQSASIFGTFFDPSMIGSNTICSLSYLPSGYDNFQFDDIQPQIVLTVANATSGTIVVTGNYQSQLTFGIFLQLRNAQQSSGFYRVVSSLYNTTTNQTTIVLSSNIGQFSGGELVFGLDGFDPMYTNFDFSNGIINALITEDFLVNGTLTFLESVYGYNLENTDSNGYDVFSYGSEYDTIPNIISHNVSLLPQLGNNTSGIVYSGISASSSTIIPEGFDGYVYEDFYDRQPYTLWFPYWYTLNGNISGQGLLLTGGNYVRRFENIQNVTIYDNKSRLQDTTTATLGICELIVTNTPTVSGIVTSNTISVSGNFSSVFVSGYAFYISGSTLNDGWYTIIKSSFDGTYTIIITEQTMKLRVYDNPDGTIIYNNYIDSFGYIIPAIFTNQLINPATILLINYVYFNATEVSYVAQGPLNIITHETFSSGIVSGSVNDSNVFSPELTQDSHRIAIVNIIQPDIIIVNGNLTFQFPSLTRFYITGSSSVTAQYDQLTCFSSVYNSTTNQTSITLLSSLPITTTPYGYIQFINPVDDLNISSASVTEAFSFGWDHTTWFQYLILGANTIDNSFIINAPSSGLGNVPPGIDIQVINGPNAGYYQVDSSTYSVSSGAIIVTVTSSIPSGIGGGYMEPPIEMESGLQFSDKLQANIYDYQLGTVYTYETVDLINTWNTSYWSVGSFS
jgi:hypothetical protein